MKCFINILNVNKKKCDQNKKKDNCFYNESRYNKTMNENRIMM